MKIPLLILSLTLFATTLWAQNAALVIIDMQNSFIERRSNHRIPENREKLQQVLERQAHLIRVAKENQVPIIKIEYFENGETTKFINQQIGDYEKAKIFVKKSDGMFDAVSGVAKALKAHLEQLGVTELIITGANGGACVKCSIETALFLNYKILADSRAIIDFNKAQFTYPYSYRMDDGLLKLKPSDANAGFNETDELILIESILRRIHVPPQLPIANKCMDLFIN